MRHPSTDWPSSASRALAGAALAAALAASTGAGEVFAKPPSPAGGINASSWVAPDGSDSDMYAWDDFTLPVTSTITEVRWRGGYALAAPFGRVTDFRVSFFDSVAGGFQPLIVALPEHEDQEITIATFHTNDNAGETPAGVFGGIQMYDYHFVLPAPVTLTGGVKYWFRVVAAQAGYPDWGMTSGMGGDGGHFRYSTGMHMFQNVSNDTAFSLLDTSTPPKVRSPGFRNLGLGGVQADFVGAPTLGIAPLSVSFTNNSKGSVASHLWSFGDGSTSTLENPTHTYWRPGTYTVSLIEAGPFGVAVLTRTDYVVVENYATRQRRL